MNPYRLSARSDLDIVKNNKKLNIFNLLKVGIRVSFKEGHNYIIIPIFIIFVVSLFMVIKLIVEIFTLIYVLIGGTNLLIGLIALFVFTYGVFSIKKALRVGQTTINAIEGIQTLADWIRNEQNNRRT